MKKEIFCDRGYFLVACLFLTAMMTGCGSQKINITIVDGQTETRLMTKSGQTVEELLEEADIIVDSQDILCPDSDTEIVLNGMHITILRHAVVSINAKDKVVEVELTGKKVKDALKEAGIEVMPNDYVSHDLNAYLTDGMSILIAPRMEISLTVDGEIHTCLTRAHTVEEFLKEQKIEMGEYDRVKPKGSGKLADGMHIVIKRVEVKEIVEVEPVVFETEVTYSNSMSVGTSQITRQGENGEKRVTYQVVYVDGKEESRKVVKEEILKEAVSQLVLQGSKPRGKTVVSKEKVDDCDGSGHGYYIITYSDGTVEYQDY